MAKIGSQRDFEATCKKINNSFLYSQLDIGHSAPSKEIREGIDK
jgi:hypothetical protein